MPLLAEETTQLTIRLGQGEVEAAHRLIPTVYDQLRTLAAAYLRRERRDHTLQPTALAHEAFLRLVDGTRIEWQGKAQFLALAAEQIRRILVEHSRRRNAAKRGGGLRRTRFPVDPDFPAPGEIEFLDLDDALVALAERSPRQSKIVELRFFGGLAEKEIAHVVGVSERTVKGDWRAARAWLRQYLDG